MAQTRREQLLNFVPSYRAGYISAGGKDEDLLRHDDEIVQKMEESNVQNEAQAEIAGREDGFEHRWGQREA